MRKVPLNGLMDSLFKGIRRGPAQFGGDFGVVNRIPAVVTRAIFDVSDQALRLAQFLQNQPDNLNICYMALTVSSAPRLWELRTR